MIRNIKEKLIGASGSISGTASILGSWQVCHNVCLGLIALLSLMGITVIGMPLAFLTKIAVPLWSAAVIILLITLYIYQKKKCISRNLLILNTGLIIAGTPFQAVQEFSIYFWTIGGITAFIGISLFIKEKIEKRRLKNDKRKK
ncbi:hypothetical protein HOF78_01590 [Candidatus Woesearchaeota archaeon]|jgi:hypothetical protein|nr:hypothetical protein [Candidatus Woesearchaeota archaeon]MBT6044802.1 hypothetical protein [Candidatus Woesearchaeota archaeon]